MKYDKQTISKSSVLYQARYCAQEDISIALCKKKKIKILDHPISFKNFERRKRDFFSSIIDRSSKSVVSGSNLYCLFSEKKQKFSFAKFSKSSESLNFLPSVLDERSSFCVCSFMKKIFVLGGYESMESINSCMAYDCKRNEWNYIAPMNESRGSTACAVFHGKIVITGGWVHRRLISGKFSFDLLKSVESYCPHENKWTQLPDMLQRKCSHGIASIGNKMYVIAYDFRNSCEVFDTVTNKFTIINSNQDMKRTFIYSPKNSAFTVGYKIHVFKIKRCMEERTVFNFCYDVKEDAWTSESICNVEYFDDFSRAKMFKH